MSTEDNSKPATQTKEIHCPICYNVEIKRQKHKIQVLLLQDYEVRQWQ
jgi:hypothetical protein